MPELVLVPLDLDQSHLRKLYKAETVQVKHPMIGKGECQVALTQSKAKRLAKAMETGKGMRLALSKKERTANNGRGLFSSIRKFAGPVIKAVAPIIKDKAKDLLKKGVDKLPLPDAVKDIAKQGVDVAVDKGSDLALARAGLPSQGFIAGFNGRGYAPKKRAPSAYNNFVKAYVNKHKGKKDIKLVFSDAAKAWRAQKK